MITRIYFERGCRSDVSLYRIVDSEGVRVGGCGEGAGGKTWER